MAYIPVDKDFKIHCSADDYLFPWENPVPVLFVHGFSRSGAIWACWIPHIAETRRAYRLDLRGCGKSDVPRNDGYVVTLDMIFSDILKTLDHFGIKKAHLVGESSSGQSMTVFALEHPERVASVTTCETTPKMQQWVFDAYKLDRASPMDAIRHYGTAEWCQRTLAYRLDKDHATEELSQWMVELIGRTPSHVAAAMIECFFQMDNWPRFGALTVPLLQLTGSQKTATNVDEQREVNKAVPDGRLKIFEGFRGMIHIFQAKACALEALRFWNDVDSGKKVRE